MIIFPPYSVKNTRFWQKSTTRFHESRENSCNNRLTNLRSNDVETIYAAMPVCHRAYGMDEVSSNLKVKTF